MISKKDFEEGVEIVCTTFNRKIPPAVVAVWYRFLGSSFDGTTWAEACRATIKEEDSFPSNFVRAMISRRPQKTYDAAPPINPDTGEPFTVEEQNRNLERYRHLRLICGDRDNPRRKKILSCALAAEKAGDTKAELVRWGGFIEELLDDSIAESEA